MNLRTAEGLGRPVRVWEGLRWVYRRSMKGLGGLSNVLRGTWKLLRGPREGRGSLKKCASNGTGSNTPPDAADSGVARLLAVGAVQGGVCVIGLPLWVPLPAATPHLSPPPLHTSAGTVTS